MKVISSNVLYKVNLKKIIILSYLHHVEYIEIREDKLLSVVTWLGPEWFVVRLEAGDLFYDTKLVRIRG